MHGRHCKLIFSLAECHESPQTFLLKRVPLCYFNKTFLFNRLFVVVVVLVFAAFHSEITSMFSQFVYFLCNFYLYSNQDITRESGNGFLRSSTPPQPPPPPPTPTQLSSMKISLLRCSLIIWRRCFHVLLLRILCYSQWGHSRHSRYQRLLLSVSRSL